MQEKADLTERTVFRYFDTKADLVLETVLLFWEKVQSRVYSLYFDQESKKSGIDQIRDILKGYAQIYFTYSNELIFIHEAEAYLYRTDKLKFIENKNLLPYESSNAPLAIAIQKGVDDGSVRTDIDLENLYYNTFDALLGLIQKLVILGYKDEKSQEHAQKRLSDFCEIIVKGYCKN